MGYIIYIIEEWSLFKLLLNPQGNYFSCLIDLAKQVTSVCFAKKAEWIKL